MIPKPQVNGKQNLIQKIIKLKIFQKKLSDAKTEKVVIKLGEKINFLNCKKIILMMDLKDILVSQESHYLAKFLHKDVKVSDDDEEGTFRVGTELNDAVLQQILDANIQLNLEIICN